MPRKRLFIRELEYLEGIVGNRITIQGGSVKVTSYTSAYAEGSSLAATRGGLDVTIQGGSGKANSYTNAYAEGSYLSRATGNSNVFVQVDSD